MDKVDVRFPKERKAPPPNLPRNAEERAVALVDLMGRLAATLDRETAAAEAHAGSPVLARCAQDKQPMALVLEEVSRLLRVDREGMAGLPAETRERLAAATRSLAASAAANAEALSTGSHAQRLLVDTLVTAVNRARHHQPGVAYGPGGPVRGPGAVRGYGPPTHGPGTAATLNTRL